MKSFYSKRGPETAYTPVLATVERLNIENGTFAVRTQTGELLDRARLLTDGGGPTGLGVQAMPLPGSLCVALRSSKPHQPHLVAGTFASWAKGDDEEGLAKKTLADDLAPGDWRYLFENEGMVRFSLDGQIEMSAHPWAERVYLPGQHLIRDHARNWETVSSPMNLLRYKNSLEEGSSFFEMYLNERFVHREGDKYPSIIWTMGDNTRGDLGAFNPKSPFLSYRQIEKRPRDNAEAIARYTEELGEVDGVVAQQAAEHLASETTILRTTGHLEDGTAERRVISVSGGKATLEDHAGDRSGVSRETKDVIGESVEIRDRQGHFDGDSGKLVKQTTASKDGSAVYDVTVQDDGKTVLTTPAWTVTLHEDARATIESESTSIGLDGEVITIGNQGGDEHLVLGDTLVQLLNEIIQWATQHTHPTPAGPSSPPITAAQLTSIQSTYQLTGALATILSSANRVSKGSTHGSGDAPTA